MNSWVLWYWHRTPHSAIHEASVNIMKFMINAAWLLWRWCTLYLVITILIWIHYINGLHVALVCLCSLYYIKGEMKNAIYNDQLAITILTEFLTWFMRHLLTLCNLKQWSLHQFSVTILYFGSLQYPYWYIKQIWFLIVDTDVLDNNISL